jgi:hypothetical protein
MTERWRRVSALALLTGILTTAAAIAQTPPTGTPATPTPPATPQTPPATPQAPPPSPCPTQPEYRQLDFWVGEWDVTDHGTKIAESSIQRIVDQCIIFENYTEPPSYTGKSFNFYDATLKKWRQTWVDSQGNVSEFTGEFRDGAMHLEGESHRANGRRVLRKMVLTPLEGGRVRQYSERSLDEGKTWGVAYDYVYVPRGPR